MTVFYTGRGARITHERFEAQSAEIRSLEIRSFEIKALSNVRVVERDAASTPVAGWTVRLVHLGAATTAVVVVISGWVVLDVPYLSFVALAVLAVTVASYARYARAHRRSFEIWSQYHGAVVCIYRTTDTRTFGQVKRGLIRAIEYRSKAA